jgi:thymidylate synthase ThyX
MMTHRVFARNSESSRAMPAAKTISRVRKNPVVPIEWGANNKGMESNSPLEAAAATAAEQEWSRIAQESVSAGERLLEIGVHKQWLNRVIEPFNTITVVITATAWDNFFSLRCSKEAQPEMQRIAWLMLKRMVESTPSILNFGQWHMPFSDTIKEEGISVEDKLKICTARCARTSYLNHEGLIDFKKDIELHDNLANDGHWSPFEHCAKAVDSRKPELLDTGCYVGWLPYRKTFSREHKAWINRESLLKDCPFREWLETV